MSNNQKWLVGGLIGIVFITLCIATACVMLGGLAFFTIGKSTAGEIPPPSEVTVEAAPVTPSQVATQASKPPDPAPIPQESTPTMDPAIQDAEETLRTLEKAVVPNNDPRDLARRLQGKENIPETVPAPSQPLAVGNQTKFWALNVDTDVNFQIDVTLQYISDHVYFWVENGVRYNSRDVKRLVDTFESKIYPTDHEFFGSEWTPGIDNDPHLYVVFARGLGSGIAGYFSSADELSPQLHKYSNAHEMFMLNADGLNLGGSYVYGTMAHEFQHMIHWYRDRNETSWINEGFAVLAEFLNGYDIGGFDFLYVQDPDLQLTYWPSPGEATPHYGASFLFLAYFLDRFGDQATQALVGDPDNGMDSIDKVLASLNKVDSQTGKVIQADDVFADWVVSSYLDDPNAGDGRYAYRRYQNPPRPVPTEEINNCSPDWQDRTVHQYGVDYIKIDCSGSYTLNFQGSSEVGVLPENAHSGKYAFWSNKGDESDMTLTRAFDFSQVTGPLTLKYFTWYDLEKDYDYLYVEASVDDSPWQILKTPSGRDQAQDLSGNAYGWGYTGQSDGWIEESLDLSQFAGKKVQIRFEYVTDGAVNGEGLLLDDIRIPEINDSTDFETDDGGWQGDGFVRIQNKLPQLFRISLIQEGRQTTVQTIALEPGQAANLPLQFGSGTRDAVLVVSGVTRFTTQEANYRFRFQK